MKNALPALLKVSIFTGILLFSLYAFNVNEGKRSYKLDEQIRENAEKAETLERVNKGKVSNLQGKINSMNRGRHDRYETLLMMFPDDESRKMINALFEVDSKEDNEESEAKEAVEAIIEAISPEGEAE